MKTATAKELTLTADPSDKTLKLTMEQYETLRRFWWAVGQFNQLLGDQPDAPSDVLGITLEYVGPVFEDLWRQELALKQVN